MHAKFDKKNIYWDLIIYNSVVLFQEYFDICASFALNLIIQEDITTGMGK